MTILKKKKKKRLKKNGMENGRNYMKKYFITKKMQYSNLFKYPEYYEKKQEKQTASNKKK